MTKRLNLVAFLLFFAFHCWAQGSSNETVTDFKEAPVTTAALKQVLFATNEDCDLYINGAFKSTVSKNAHKYLKLSPGNYLYKVKSRTSADEFSANFTVKEGGLNEVFIDLLYFIEEKAAQKESEKAKQLTASRSGNIRRGQPARKPAANSVATILSEGQVVESLLSNMISISGGSFIMGNNKAPANDEEEHTVTISPILFSKYEVTQEQWETIMGNNPSEFKGCNTCPVENVSWEDAMKFIRKVNSISKQNFRLPTETEWEYVARLGGKQEIDKEGGPEAFIKKTAWYYGNANKKTHPVGEKQPNVTGIYDLFGNVAEWCSDWYSPTYFKEESNQKDPEGPPLGKEKIYRGGSFEDFTGDKFRPSLRNKLKPTSKSKSIGFRLVMELE